MYCIEMNRPEGEFLHGTFTKIITMIDMYADKMQMKAAAMNQEQYNSKYFSAEKEPEVIEIKSMKEIVGW